MAAVVSKKTEILAEMQNAFGIVPEWAKSIPEAALNSFWSGMRDFQLAETSIPNKYKELIGLGVAAATHCRYCQLFHATGARLNGATEEEIAEAVMFAATTSQGSTFLNGMAVDFAQFTKEVEQIKQYIERQAAITQKTVPPPVPRERGGVHS